MVKISKYFTEISGPCNLNENDSSEVDDDGNDDNAI